MVKIAVIDVEKRSITATGLLWVQIADHVDAGRVQPLHGAEKVAGAKAETGVGPVFLHHMPDELDAVARHQSPS